MKGVQCFLSLRNEHRYLAKKKKNKKKDFKLLPGFLSFFYEKDVVSNGYFSYVVTWNMLTLIY